METPPAEPAPPRRPRARRLLIWTGASVAALILLGVIFAPPVIAGVIKSQLTSNLADRIDGTSSVGGVAFSWFSGVTISNLEIKDPAGAPLASVKSISADLSLLSAIGGKIIATVRIDSPRIDVRRRADGRLNLAAAVKTSAADPAAPSAKAPRALPFLDVKLAINNASLVVAGEKEATQFDISGSYSLHHDAGRVALTGETAVKDGSVTIAVDADLERAAKADLKINRVPLDARMGPFLELLHPALSVAGGKLDGFIDGDLSLVHTGSLAADADAILKKLNGGGHVEIRDSTFSGSQFLGELMAALALEKREIKLRPLGFRIDNGRLTYEKPWQWSISGADTTFTGSIGLDRTLDLVWHIPVTDELAARVSTLKSSKGKTYDVAIKGTVTRPKLDWKGVIKDVAEDKIEDAAKKGLESLLSSREEKAAKKLLEEADSLYKQGRTDDAAAKYRKIKYDYGRSRVYKDNQVRIDPRAEGK